MHYISLQVDCVVPCSTWWGPQGRNQLAVHYYIFWIRQEIWQILTTPTYCIGYWPRSQAQQASRWSTSSPLLLTQWMSVTPNSLMRLMQFNCCSLIHRVHTTELSVYIGVLTNSADFQVPQKHPNELSGFHCRTDTCKLQIHNVHAYTHYNV